MKRLNKTIYLLVIAVLMQSCATIFSGTKSRVKVKGAPEGASVYYNGNYEDTAPCRVKVSKKSLKDGNTKIQIKEEGYKDTEVTLSRKIKIGAVIGNFLIFPVGHIVDFATGAIYKPYPGRINYNLIPKSVKSKSGKFKAGDTVLFTHEKYVNQKGEIVAVYPKRVLIKFSVKNNIIIAKLTGKEYSEKKVEVPYVNIAKQ